MNKRKTANIVIDTLMTVLMPLLMAYSLIGEEFHEIVGTVIFILFIIHHILHLKWWRAIPRGKYNPYRGFITVFNIILLIVMFLQPLSGIALSKHLYAFLQLKGVAATARTIHMICAYWCYVLLSLHFGLHTDQIIRPLKNKREPLIIQSRAEVRKIYGIILSKLRRNTDVFQGDLARLCREDYVLMRGWEFLEVPKKSFGIIKWTGRIVFIMIAAYGVYAFIHRGFWGYMSGKMMFAFFDFSEARILFIADYLAVMTLFSVIGNYLGKLLKLRRNSQ